MHTESYEKLQKKIAEILRNKEDLKILCNMGKTFRFRSVCKLCKTELNCNIRCSVIHCLMGLILEDWNDVKHGGQEGKKGKRGADDRKKNKRNLLRIWVLED